MATTKCISANSVKVNAATIAQAGAVTDTAKNNDLSLSELNTYKRNYGSYVYKAVSTPSSGNIGTALAYGAGTFSSFVKGQYIMMVAGKYISGVATTLFQSPSSKIMNRPFNSIKVTHTVYLTGLQWSGNSYTYTRSAQAPDFLADKCLLDLGRLTYRTGSPTVTTQNYQTKYSM